MTDKDKIIQWFNDIAEMCSRLTTGNVSHLGATIKGKAIRAAEYIEKHSLPEEHINFPHERNIVDKVFGAGNLESFEHSEAEQLVLLAKRELLKDFIDSLPEESASKDLEEYAKKLAKGAALDEHNLIWMCKKGAEWQKKQMRETLQTE